jgi:hypothetical protein
MAGGFDLVACDYLESAPPLLVSVETLSDSIQIVLVFRLAISFEFQLFAVSGLVVPVRHEACTLQYETALSTTECEMDCSWQVCAAELCWKDAWSHPA